MLVVFSGFLGDQVFDVSEDEVFSLEEGLLQGFKLGKVNVLEQIFKVIDSR